MNAIYFNRAYDEIRPNGTRESDELARRIARVFPDAIWRRESEDLWRIVVD